MDLVPDELLRDVEAWSGCVAGALEERDYLDKLRRAGFADAAIEVTNVYDGAPENSCCGAPALPGRRTAHQRLRARRQAVSLKHPGSNGGVMERVIGIDHTGGWSRDETMKAEQLRHRRAAAERCARAGLLRRCTPVPPAGSWLRLRGLSGRRSGVSGS